MKAHRNLAGGVQVEHAHRQLFANAAMAASEVAQLRFSLSWLDSDLAVDQATKFESLSGVVAGPHLPLGQGPIRF